MPTIVFNLYVAGTTSYNKQLLQLYEEACDHCIKEGKYRIEVIDLLKNPDLAEKYKVLGTPTISRLTPTPEKRIIGKVNGEQAVSAIKFLIDDLSIS